MSVVLSLFSGVGLLDTGFEAAGHCIVRGPDLLWGSDIRKFSGKPLADKVNGIIGGVPCQRFSSAVKKENRSSHPDLWPEFWRVVDEVKPAWILAENVCGAEGAATDMFSVPASILPTYKKIVFSDLGSAQARPRLIVFAGYRHAEFWAAIGRHGLKWGQQWRESIGRDIGIKCRSVMGGGTISDGGAWEPKYRTVTGDSLIQKQCNGESAPAYYLKGDDLLDAFDLPVDWELPAHARFSRGTRARLITQGVPVAAAYALGMAVKKAYEGTK